MRQPRRARRCGMRAHRTSATRSMLSAIDLRFTIRRFNNCCSSSVCPSLGLFVKAAYRFPLLKSVGKLVEIAKNRCVHSLSDASPTVNAWWHAFSVTTISQYGTAIDPWHRCRRYRLRSSFCHGCDAKKFFNSIDLSVLGIARTNLRDDSPSEITSRRTPAVCGQVPVGECFRIRCRARVSDPRPRNLPRRQRTSFSRIELSSRSWAALFSATLEALSGFQPRARNPSTSSSAGPRSTDRSRRQFGFRYEIVEPLLLPSCVCTSSVASPCGPTNLTLLFRPKLWRTPLPRRRIRDNGLGCLSEEVLSIASSSRFMTTNPVHQRGKTCQIFHDIRDRATLGRVFDLIQLHIVNC